MRPVPVRILAGAGILALTTTLAACGGNGDAGGETTTLQVLAAASLTDVFTDLGEQFSSEHDGVAVEVSFGSSTDLAEQAADGAPGDVIATADPEAMEIATDAGAASDDEVFATNVLVMVTAPDNPAGIETIDDLAETTWVRCADEVPCGRVALSLLEETGITAEPVSLEEDVRATLEKVTSGEADAGLVYATDAVAAGEDVATIEIPEAEEHANSYLIAELAQTSDADLAAQFVELVTGPEGQQALTDAGFDLP